MIHKKWYQTQSFQIALITLVTVFFVWDEWLFAANYQLLFNNVEQGDNSTSNPTVQVNDGKAIKKADTAAATTQAAETTPLVLQPTPAAAESTTATAPSPSLLNEGMPKRPFRLGLQGFAIKSQSRGGLFTGTFFPLRDLGITALVGWPTSDRVFWGGELEVVPLHLSLFGVNHFLNIGGVVGATTLGKNATSDGRGTGHVGVKTALNLGERFAITGGVRTNFTQRSQYTYLMADVGLAVRF